MFFKPGNGDLGDQLGPPWHRSEEVRHRMRNSQKPVTSVRGRTDNRRHPCQCFSRVAKVNGPKVRCIAADKEGRRRRARHPGTEIAIALLDEGNVRTQPVPELGNRRAGDAELEWQSRLPDLGYGMLDEIAVQAGCTLLAERGNEPSLGFARTRKAGEQDDTGNRLHGSIIGARGDRATTDAAV